MYEIDFNLFYVRPHDRLRHLHSGVDAAKMLYYETPRFQKIGRKEQ